MGDSQHKIFNISFERNKNRITNRHRDWKSHHVNCVRLPMAPTPFPFSIQALPLIKRSLTRSRLDIVHVPKTDHSTKITSISS